LGFQTTKENSLKPSADEYWAKNASKYDKEKNGSIDKIIDTICTHIDSSHISLDVATGTGIAAIQLSNFARHVDAIDSESKMLAAAQAKIDAGKIENLTLHRQNAYGLEFPNSYFDSVVVLNSLHIMENPQKALKEIKRVIKPTGVLFSPTYCHSETEEILSNYKKWSKESGHKSYHLFTSETLCDLIRNNGFSVKESEMFIVNHGDKYDSMAIGYVASIPK